MSSAHDVLEPTSPGGSPCHSVDAETQVLLHKSPPTPARRFGPYFLAAGLLVVACCAALLASWKPLRAELGAQVGLGMVIQKTKLIQAAEAGAICIHVEDSSIFSTGDALILDEGDTDHQEIRRVGEVTFGNDTITLLFALRYAHALNAVVSNTEHTPMEEELDDFVELSSYEVPLTFGATKSAHDVKIDQGCTSFEIGDEVSIGEEENLVTDVTINDDGTCLLELGWPILQDHTTEEMLSKKVPPDWQAAPTPVPAFTPAPPGGPPPPHAPETPTPSTTPSTTTKANNTATKRETAVNPASVDETAVKTASVDETKKSSCMGLPNVGLAIWAAVCAAAASGTPSC